MCDYKDELIESYECPHPDYGPGKDEKRTFCIFHNDREDKDVEKFYKGFKKLYKSGKHDFRDFIFPEGFDFRRLKKVIEVFEFKEANFEGARFLGMANFEGATFSGLASFWRARFSERANFDGATFSGEATFADARFSGEANFEGARFSGMANFEIATFSETCKVIFYGKTFKDNATVYFYNLNIEKDAYLTFDNVSLKRARFLGTDLEKIDFNKVYWNNMEFEPEDEKEKTETEGKKESGTFFKKLKAESKDFVKRIKGEDRIMVFDETFQKGFSRKGGVEKNHYEVQQLYNQLRINYEKTGRYHEARDFFVGAMEMRRKGTREKKVIRKILTLYKWISLYGERPVRALLWLIATPFIFLPLYFFNGITTRLGVDPAYTINYDLVHSAATPSFWSDLGRTLYFSISNIWLGRTFTNLIPENGWTILISIFENITGVVLISLFILAMNRKFRRTKD